MTPEELEVFLKERRQIQEDHRTFNERIHSEVRGLCTGKTTWLTDEEIADSHRAEILKDWREKYGEDPPEEWLESEVSDHVWEVTNSDYPPKKCEKCAHGPHKTIPNYCDNLNDAFILVNEMIKEDRYVKLQWNGTNWFCVMTRRNDALPVIDSDGETLPAAICFAALRVRNELKD